MTGVWSGPCRSGTACRVGSGFDEANRWLPYDLISNGPLGEVTQLATAAMGPFVLACCMDVPRRC